MAKGKGIGPVPIIAIAVVSTVFTIVLDHYGVTKAVENFVRQLADAAHG